ncbi:hypothetical protein [Methylorubrum extorquens]|uniref:Uncharacterized protein n=2 Tax=Methylorubrum extorquens TaxID=408 RepID=C5B6K2_METEA|nr:hypothetical protein [Methylorubrum extorquens]ACS44084.1 Hypothetical protein MexAM1_META2p1346 [Methylorubrum extorquens AM1]EHP90666.1 hypothetical protein MetexDRAFT_4446 [Methylorubrum extorquens DSM 13060]MCP1546051.1 hypothetical protein [Methylorubrum extorquens]MCP1590718.1 hypothetical protein [Methylorubrum extorquens]
MPEALSETALPSVTVCVASRVDLPSCDGRRGWRFSLGVEAQRLRAELGAVPAALPAPGAP